MIPVDKVKKLVREKGYGFNHYKYPLDRSTRIVLVGERHANYSDHLFQGDLIEMLKPETVMHEFYEPKGKPSPSDTVRVAVDWINGWKRKYEVQLKPCDLPSAKICQFYQKIYDFLEELTELGDEPELNSIIVDDNAIRELVMGKLIRTESEKTDKPLIAIVGAYHVRPESRIHKKLRCQRAIKIGGRMPISYVTINQYERLNQEIKSFE